MQNEHEEKGLSSEEKWSVVKSCDKEYDGRFFYGVVTTKIFCRPSCKARTPLRENIRFFSNASDALCSGFRPCKKCRPDLPEYDPEREMVEKAKERFAFELDPQDRETPSVGILPVSANHLARLFKKYEGCTPGQYFTRLRVEKAKRMLAETGMTILDVAFLCGFGSLSNFYKQFQKYTCGTPGDHRFKRPGAASGKKEDKPCSSFGKHP